MSAPRSNLKSGHASYDKTYTAYQSQRGVLRRWVRRYYLRAAARFAHGPSLDFGCGVGELLQRLPPGSMGVEYNMATVEYCHRIGLNVIWYDGFEDNFALTAVPWKGCAKTLFLCHVLEHFDDPAHVLKQLAHATEHEIERIVVIVPGKAGFRADATHRTFVDFQLLKTTVSAMKGWSITCKRYFPANHVRVGDYFAHNELQVVIDQTQTTSEPHDSVA